MLYRRTALHYLATFGVALASCSKPESPPPGHVQHSILRQWIPKHKSRQGAVAFTDSIGLDILLEADVDQPELVSFVKEKALGGEYVIIRVYTSRECWSDQTGESDACKTGIVLVYLKNPSSGQNEIRWVQQEGKFSGLFGTATPLQ